MTETLEPKPCEFINSKKCKLSEVNTLKANLGSTANDLSIKELRELVCKAPLWPEVRQRDCCFFEGLRKP